MLDRAKRDLEKACKKLDRWKTYTRYSNYIVNQRIKYLTLLADRLAGEVMRLSTDRD
jgi:hypothetical protein